MNSVEKFVIFVERRIISLERMLYKNIRLHPMITKRYLD